MEVRRRNVESSDAEDKSPSIAKMVQNLDAFPKLPEECKETTLTGAGVSLVVFTLIAILVVSEVYAYFDYNLQFTYEIDKDHDSMLRINVDVTVAMKCEFIGADVVDNTGHAIENMAQLREDGVHFELSKDQKEHFESLSAINTFLRNEYHAVHEILWKHGRLWSAFGNSQSDEVTNQNNGPIDACRLRGSFFVRKMPGNFHITIGKHVNMGASNMHAHLSFMMSPQDYNLSHRIDHFSFGDPAPGRVFPLDAQEIITKDPYHMFQYFIQVVPTRVNTRQAFTDTYQFAVTEQNRTIDHSKGSHGTPGIFVRYDVSPVTVTVTEASSSIAQLLVKLAAIVGGIFATSGMLQQAVSFFIQFLALRYKWGDYRTAPLDVPGYPSALNT